jgi:hypothetical protein
MHRRAVSADRLGSGGKPAFFEFEAQGSVVGNGPDRYVRGVNLPANKEEYSQNETFRYTIIR